MASCSRVATCRPAWALTRDPLPFETSMPGVFAVGDVRHGSIKRVAEAVGEGSVAVGSVHRYLAEEPLRTAQLSPPQPSVPRRGTPDLLTDT